MTILLQVASHKLSKLLTLMVFLFNCRNFSEVNQVNNVINLSITFPALCVLSQLCKDVLYNTQIRHIVLNHVHYMLIPKLLKKIMSPTHFIKLSICKNNLTRQNVGKSDIKKNNSDGSLTSRHTDGGKLAALSYYRFYCTGETFG